MELSGHRTFLKQRINFSTFQHADACIYYMAGLSGLMSFIWPAVSQFFLITFSAQNAAAIPDGVDNVGADMLDLFEIGCEIEVGNFPHRY